MLRNSANMVAEMLQAAKTAQDVKDNDVLREMLQELASAVPQLQNSLEASLERPQLAEELFSYPEMEKNEVATAACEEVLGNLFARIGRQAQQSKGTCHDIALTRTSVLFPSFRRVAQRARPGLC